MSDRAADEERWEPEPPKSPSRTAFGRDRARVLHSSALRRLAAKTQVVRAWRTDFPRTRLTHTLECAQIGRELAAALGADQDLVETACLAHDLGHPPFGHTGEAALDELALSIGGFEGNAQSLRLLTRLEPKVFAGPAHPDVPGRSVGLNLTRASLDAATKYPWTRRPGSRKFGAYGDDVPALEWARRGAPEGRRSLESQLMDFADDVAYSVHDTEDAFQAGHLLPEALQSSLERAQVLRVARQWYAPHRDEASLAAALDRVLAQPAWPRSFAGSMRDLAGLKDLASELIGRFSAAAIAATRERYGPADLRRYDADLVVPDHVRDEVDVLKAVAAHFVMLRADTGREHEHQRAVLGELVQTMCASPVSPVEPWLATAWDDADDDGRLRVVLDQVACLTDVSVMAWHAELTAGSGTPPRK